MFGGQEWIWIVIIALVLFGGSQIPKLAKNIGQAQTEFKKGLAEGKGEDGENAVESEATAEDKRSK